MKTWGHAESHGLRILMSLDEIEGNRDLLKVDFSVIEGTLDQEAVQLRKIKF